METTNAKRDLFLVSLNFNSGKYRIIGKSGKTVIVDGKDCLVFKGNGVIFAFQEDGPPLNFKWDAQKEIWV